jgi:hypothetical protein
MAPKRKTDDEDNTKSKSITLGGNKPDIRSFFGKSISKPAAPVNSNSQTAAPPAPVPAASSVPKPVQPVHVSESPKKPSLVSPKKSPAKKVEEKKVASAASSPEVGGVKKR